MGMKEFRDKMAEAQQKMGEVQFKADGRVLGITITGDGAEARVQLKNGGGPVAGARARLESSGDIERRITATRLVLTGPFALALRKKKDHRTLWLTIEGEGYETFAEVSPKREVAARRWIASFNTLAMNTPA